ncbi:holin-like protein [Synechococcus phage S-SCSM1]|uniref:Holin-like protein n=1 Tax=Synechococcus phage S-SCSM1 TaxID=2588487 RepID=A0A6M2ZIY3_9CAUD|nr:holin-like protein [Synechococcus phage S-SCSM1]QFG06355.1 holin-like protein [Synechococcus phage S-SCSM1]
MFGRLTVLESKLDIYEDLSKEMLDKLERAVTTISDNSNKIAIVLERHENRLDEVDRADQLILKMIEEMKSQHDKDTKTLHDRLSNLQKKVDHNAKFVVGAGAVLATLVAVLQVVPPVIKFLTPTANASMMPIAEVVSFVNGSN